MHVRICVKDATPLETTVFFVVVVVYFIKHVMLILTLFKLDLNLAIHIGMIHKWKNWYTTI